MPSLQIANFTLNQNIPLTATGTKVRIWLSGNGTSAYTVNGGSISQGAVTVSITVNGQTSFQIPSMGRWSDYFSTVGFTLPNTCTMTTSGYGSVPVLDLTDLGGSGSVPAVSDRIDYDLGTNVVVTYRVAYVLASQILTSRGIIGVTGWSDTSFLESLQTEYTTSVLCEIVDNVIVIKHDVQYLSQADEEGSIYIEYFVSGVNSGVVSIGMRYYEYKQMISGEAQYGTLEALVSTLAEGFNTLIPDSASASGNTLTWSLNEQQATLFKQMLYPDPDAVKYFASYPVYGIALNMMLAVLNSPDTVDGTYTPPSGRMEFPLISHAKIYFDYSNNVADGDTLTFNVGDTQIVFTLKNVLTGGPNEILIGADNEKTAENAEVALNSAPWAMFRASTDAQIVKVIIYTSELVTISRNNEDAIAVLWVRQTPYGVINESFGTIPAIRGGGYAPDGTAFIPAFTGYGECTGEDFAIGYGAIPHTLSYAQSYLNGCTSSSADADKIALMLYGNGWMEWFSGLIAVAGDDDDVALVTTQWVADNIAYTTDTLLYSTADYWADPRLTLKNAAGDCEDFAFLLASLMLNNGVDPSRVRVYMGTANGVGHSWVCYQRTIDDEWIILDATKG